MMVRVLFPGDDLPRQSLDDLSGLQEAKEVLQYQNRRSRG